MHKFYNTIRLLLIFILISVIPILLLSCRASTSAAVSDGNLHITGHMESDTDGAVITLETAGSKISTLTADPENILLLKIHARDKNGGSMENAKIKLEIAGISNSKAIQSERDDNYGQLSVRRGTTGKGGTFFSAYSPPGTIDNDTSGVTITAYLEGTDASSSLTLKLVPVPVVLIHGYQATHEIFSGLDHYLQIQGITTLSMDYNSISGVAAGAEDLSRFLAMKKADLAADGVQTTRFDLVAHSMGGLVARYYTCSNEYTNNGNVRKLIFISVPQQGSPFASLGQQYFSDRSIRELAVDSELFTSIFPSMINMGLNPSIQTAGILGRYDEVVSIGSASLEAWDIGTEIFDVGESSLTIDKLLSGEILNAENHKLILYNSKVYDRIKEMLLSYLPFPSTK